MESAQLPQSLSLPLGVLDAEGWSICFIYIIAMGNNKVVSDRSHHHAYQRYWIGFIDGHKSIFSHTKAYDDASNSTALNMAFTVTAEVTPPPREQSNLGSVSLFEYLQCLLTSPVSLRGRVAMTDNSGEAAFPDLILEGRQDVNYTVIWGSKANYTGTGGR